MAIPIRAEQPNVDFWLDKIHCGDVLDTLAAMPDQCVDLIITSPPYNALQTTGGGWRHGLGKWGRRRRCCAMATTPTPTGWRRRITCAGSRIVSCEP